MRKQQPLPFEDDLNEVNEIAQEGSNVIIEDVKQDNEDTPTLIYNCKICHKSYKTLNQIKAHLKTKKHFNKHLNYHYNNSTLNHESDIIPNSIKPKLEIEGNEFVEITEEQGDDQLLNSNIEGLEESEQGMIGNTLSTSHSHESDSNDSDSYSDDDGQGIDHFECVFCDFRSDSIDSCFKHMNHWHNFEIPC